MTKALELGYKSHDAGTCGLHNHIDRGFFEYEDTSIVDWKFTLSFQNNFWWMKRFSRRDDYRGNWGYCNPNGNRYMNVEDKIDKETVKNKQFLNAIKGCGGHGIAMNFEHGNTIEIRFYRGTLKYNTFLATLQCSDIWARLIKGITLEEATDIELKDFVHLARERGYDAFINYLSERGITYDSEPKRKAVRFSRSTEYHYVDFEDNNDDRDADF